MEDATRSPRGLRVPAAPRQSPVGGGTTTNLFQTLPIQDRPDEGCLSPHKAQLEVERLQASALGYIW